MAQTLKKEVKENIDFSALICFSKHGFIKTTMKSIAEEAKLSVGNIYKYYKNKEELFYSLVDTTFLNDLKKNLALGIKYSIGQEIGELLESKDFIDTRKQVIDFIFENRLKVIILLSDMEGSKYNNFLVQTSEEMAREAVNYYQSVKQYKLLIDDKIIANLLPKVYENLYDLLKHILEKTNERALFYNLYSKIHNYHLAGLKGLWKMD